MRCGSDDEADFDGDFQPDASGYVVTLVDGTSTRLRFRRELVHGCATLNPEIRMANRALPEVPGQELPDMCKRVLSVFTVPHQLIVRGPAFSARTIN